VSGAGGLLVWPVGRLWVLPAGGAILGVLGLAGAWPGLAGRSGLRFWQRALLGAAGFLWLAGADSLADPRIFTTRRALAPPSVWTASVRVTLHDVLTPLMASGVLLAAGVWAVAAVVAPWLARRNRPMLSLVAITVWSAATVGAVQSLGPARFHGAVIGALAGTVVVLAPVLPALVGLARDQGRMAPRVP
ncbi:MAG TPA: hypothetical protein VFP55_01315, partial [Solirubrobacteraceae bacterium]|nr:hypothetical protein [Solirubrobacteraceae bacterium]